MAWAEIAPSGELGAGDWRMLISGQAPAPISRPDIYASFREGVDYQSHAFVEAQTEADRGLLRAELRRTRSETKEIKAARTRRVANLTRHLTTLRTRAKQQTEIAKLLKPKKSQRPAGESVCDRRVAIL
jgi:hypothetical protein